MYRLTETLPPLAPETLTTLDFIYRGDDVTLTVTATYPEDIPEQSVTAGDPFPLADKDIWFTAKHKAKEEDVSAEFQKTSGVGGGITVRAAPNNHIADIEISASDTADMTKSALLVCDVQTKGTKTWTVWKGYLPVYADVTRAT